MKDSDPITYLSPPRHSFWRWSADGQTLEWADGRTIAFRQEVHAVLHRLSRSGLPPFGAVVLLLAACRDTWSTSGTNRGLISAYARSLAASVVEGEAFSMVNVIAEKMEVETARVVEGLDRVAQLMPDVRTILPAKINLADMVFEQGKREVDEETAKEVVERLACNDFFQTTVDLYARNHSLYEFVDALEALRGGLPGICEDRLRLREKTGLDQLVREPEELDLSPAQRVRRLLMELRQGDPELAALAKLAQEILAAVHVPRALTARLDLPVGGVSDISHRGPLDRLLVSELAHDDLTLAVRVATNEALYLRREAPPQTPPNRRALLIDCGIRMWGVPRIFAAAVSLALIANADAKAEVVSFRATDGGGVEGADITRRNGLVEHLEKLCTSPHPGRSIGKFLETVGGEEISTDSILVTHENTLADANFAAVCAKIGDAPWHVATVAASGAFKLYAITREGRRVVCQATLNLAGALAPPSGPAPVPLLDPARVSDLPVILTTEPFPILLPFDPIAEASCVTRDQGLIGVTHGRLMHWRDPRTGARELTAGLPRGRIEGILVPDSPADDTALMVIGSKAGGWTTRRDLIRANLLSGGTKQIRLQSADAPALGIAMHKEALLVFFKNSIEAFSASTGERLASLHLGNNLYPWKHGRFIRMTISEFHAIAFDGGALRSEKVPAEYSSIAVFEHAGSTFLLSQMGAVVYLENPNVVRVPPLGTLIVSFTIAHDGRRIAARTSGGRLFVVEVPGKEGWVAVPGNRPNALLGPWGEPLRTRGSPGTRRKFEGLVFHRGEILMISRPARRMLAIVRSGRDFVLSDRGEFNSALHHKLLRFNLAEGPAGARYELSAAALPDGRRIFLDSRGMVHLKHPDPREPEVTIVLAGSGPLAAWSSDGAVYGPRYFHGRDDAGDVGVIMKYLQRFAGTDTP